MDDRDLHLLREFRREDAEPPPHLQERIEERLWQMVLAEEAATSRRRHDGSWRAWRQAWLRPLAAAGAAASLALGVAVVSDGGPGTAGGAATGSITQAGGTSVFDGAASTIFGRSSTSSAPIVGSIDLTNRDTSDGLVDGPMHDAGGRLDAASAQLAQSLPRDPVELRDLVRMDVEDAGIEDPHDHAAYRTTMRWVVDPAVPVDLRAAMLRSLAGLQNVDDAVSGIDMLGRRGVVVGHLDLDSGVRTQAVLDPDGGTLLELRSFTTTYVDPACEPGTFTEHSIFDDYGRAIDPSSLPLANWPVVVAACGSVSG